MGVKVLDSWDKHIVSVALEQSVLVPIPSYVECGRFVSHQLIFNKAVNAASQKTKRKDTEWLVCQTVRLPVLLMKMSLQVQCNIYSS